MRLCQGIHVIFLPSFGLFLVCAQALPTRRCWGSLGDFQWQPGAHPAFSGVQQPSTQLQQRFCSRWIRFAAVLGGAAPDWRPASAASAALPPSADIHSPLIFLQMPISAIVSRYRRVLPPQPRSFTIASLPPPQPAAPTASAACHGFERPHQQRP